MCGQKSARDYTNFTERYFAAALTGGLPKMERDPLPAPVRGLAVASVGMAFMASVLFWWFPFGLIIGCGALTLGGIAFMLGAYGGVRRHQPEGEHLNLGLVGLMMAGSAVAVIVGLYQGAAQLMELGQ